MALIYAAFIPVGNIVKSASPARSESPLSPGWVEITLEVFQSINGVYGGTLINGVYTPPVATFPLVIPLRRFFLLFRRSQFDACMVARRTDADVDYAFRIWEVTETIELLDTFTRDYLNVLVVKGLLTAEERERILRGELPP